MIALVVSDVLGDALVDIGSGPTVADSTTIDDARAVLARYAPAFAGGTRLWLRRDVAARIERAGRGCCVSQQREDLKRALQDHRYANTDVPYDRTSFERQGVVFTLDGCAGR